MAIIYDVILTYCPFSSVIILDCGWANVTRFYYHIKLVQIVVNYFNQINHRPIEKQYLSKSKIKSISESNCI
jgi:hypothetical protein